MLLKASRPNSSATGDSSLSAFAGGGQKSTARPDPVVVCRAPSGTVRLCLRPFGIMFYAFPNLGALIHSTNMRRLTARLLLLFALSGTFVPPALAATAAPPHACCIRKAAPQCHGSGPEADQRTVHSTSCCNQGCGRGVTTSRSAYPESSLAVAVADHVDVRSRT